MKLRNDLNESVKKLGKYSVGLGATVKSVNDLLPENENVYCAVSGNIDKKAFGLIVLTNRRIIFRRKLLTIVNSRDFPLDMITSVGTDGLPFFSTLTITFAGGTSKFTNVPTKLGSEFSQEANKVIAAMSHATHQQDNNETSSSPADRLLRLKQLLDAGVLTQDEYDGKAESLKALL